MISNCRHREPRDVAITSRGFRQFTERFARSRSRGSWSRLRTLPRKSEQDLRDDYNDAASDEVRIEGTRGESAKLRFGSGLASQRAWAPSIRVSLRDGKPTNATLAAPATVLLVRELEGTKAERIELRAEGELSITAQGAETRGRTALQRSERPSPNAPFSTPSTLWTPHLVVEADRLLGGGKADLRRVTARGDGTRF